MPVRRTFMLNRPNILDLIAKYDIVKRMSDPTPNTEPIDPRWTPVDPLGEALHFLHMSGVYYTRSELTAPWGLALPLLITECGVDGLVADRPGHDWRYAIDADKITRELGYSQVSRKVVDYVYLGLGVLVGILVGMVSVPVAPPPAPSTPTKSWLGMLSRTSV